MINDDPTAEFLTEEEREQWYKDNYKELDLDTLLEEEPPF